MWNSFQEEKKKNSHKEIAPMFYSWFILTDNGQSVLLYKVFQTASMEEFLLKILDRLTS